MSHPTKIATCCYCGSRAALVLGRDRHELTCANCGAPLHDMKRLKQEPEPVEYHRTATGVRSKMPQRVHKPSKGYKPQRPRKKRKTFMRYLLKEAIDVIDDIFD